MRKFYLSILVCCFLLTGCVVGSIHPFYTPDRVVQRPDLYGRWDFDESRKPQANSQTIISDGKVTIFDDKGKPLDAKITFFQIEDSLFVDIYPDQGELKVKLVGDQPPPVHLVALIRLEQDKIRFNELNYDWLSKEVESKRINLRFTRMSENTDILFTPTSEEWVEFLKKYRQDPNAFPPDREDYMVRKQEFMMSIPQ
ncbi:MAG: hypothetical protein JNN05_02795 [Candidatus Omnitrophica bacterium]|nr:hypothetical protein [Candidatus Omnitrophota bacterium]